MQCYTELAPPTAVSHALYLPFLAPRATNLAVAKNSLLQVFELKSTVTEISPEGNENADNAAANFDTEAADVPLQRTEHTSKLVFVGEYPLAGTVIALARIKAMSTKSGAEALLIAFRDAKLSLVEWDPEAYNLSHISIHYYENPALLGAPWAADLKDTRSILTADPSSRCAVLKFGTSRLAILPFRQRGDDLVMDDYDPDLDGPREEKPKDVNGADAKSAHQTPYGASFVLPLTNLDPSSTRPVHLAFLYEYREPTFGLLTSSREPAPSLLPVRRDTLTYKVFNLNLEEKASTTLLSVSGLPYDVSTVFPLPFPIGGALLIGSNVIIHVDQAGKTHGVAVNELAKAATSFPLADQSDLALRLEGCAIELLSSDTGDVLLVLNNGRLVTLTFSLDGRSVSGVTLQPVDDDKGGSILTSSPSCASNLGRGRIFIGSEDGDSALLGWTSTSSQMARKKSQTEIKPEESDASDVDVDEDMDDGDDDLYGDTATTVKKVTAAAAEPTAPGSYTFRVHDTLPSLAPIKDVIIHPISSIEAQGPTQRAPAGDIVASTGTGRAGGIAVLNRELRPNKLKQSSIENARGLWTIHAKKQAPRGLEFDVGQDTEGNLASDAEYDQYLVVCKAGSAPNTEDTVVYEINGTDIRETSTGDFEREEGSTMNVGVLAGGTKVIQVMRTEVRTYDSELNMDQIIAMEDEDGNEQNILSSSFADPYLLTHGANGSVAIFKASSSGEVEQQDSAALTAPGWLSASLYKSPATKEVYAFLLAKEGGLHAFAMSNLESPAYVADGLAYLPPFLTAEYAPRRALAKATLTELLVADLGTTTSKSPHLIVRTSLDDLIIYKAFQYPSSSSSDAWTKNLRWIKVSQQHLPSYTDEQILEAVNPENAPRETTLIALDDVGGYSTVFQQGVSPSFILKEASSAPKVISLNSEAVKGLTRFHTEGCERGFAFVDVHDTLRISQLPASTHYGHLGWAAHKIPMGSEIHAISYHPRDIYVLGTGQMTEFTLPEDSYHHEWAKENTSFKPTVEQGIIKVVDAQNWSVIDTHILDPSEVILCIKTLELEYSETTHERRYLVAVGTAIVQGEDLATKGNIRIFEVITVVPEPDRPETNRRLRLIVKDEVKGAVSAISAIGTQGFMIMAQGQKCMVRGLKEDGTLLPVAFMDMQCYVTVLKCMPNSGMLLMGDAYKGLWFTGYTEEPYKMMLLGRSRNRMEVITAEFLPFERQLHFIIADADMNLLVLQFDPENPKSMAGNRLLHKSTFHVGHFPTSMTLLTSTVQMPQLLDDNAENEDAMDTDADGPPEPLSQILHTSQSGTIALLTPLSEVRYRRLMSLATYLSNVLDSPAGLNPRSWRDVQGETGGGGVGAARGIVDGNLLARWGELGEQRRKEGLGKVGGEELEFRGEREVLGGAGLFGRKA